MPVPYRHETPTSTLPPLSSASSPSKWGPYSGAGDFGANMVIVIVILVCALALIFALNALIRHLICAYRHRSQTQSQFPASSDPEKGSNQKSQSSNDTTIPTLIFSTATRLAGTEAECSICLGEFADGDRVRVLPACNHGFHVNCIEKWLVAHKSCPTCRASCHVEEV